MKSIDMFGELNKWNYQTWLQEELLLTTDGGNYWRCKQCRLVTTNPDNNWDNQRCTHCEYPTGIKKGTV